MKHLVPEDRGLGTAYERYCFYQLLDSWAAQFEVETFLEGPVDGMAGVAGVHGVGLARRGVKVVSAVPTEEHARVARGIYDVCKAPAEVRILGGEDPESLATLPKSDMVVCYHALSFVETDWRAYLDAVSKLARKVLVVTVCNPDNWGVAVIRALGRLRGATGIEAPESWQTDVLAPELWKLGRVREHTYFDCPWWPDLQVSAGQSLTDRLKRMARSERLQVHGHAGGEPARAQLRLWDGALAVLRRPELGLGRRADAGAPQAPVLRGREGEGRPQAHVASPRLRRRHAPAHASRAPPLGAGRAQRRSLTAMDSTNERALAIRQKLIWLALGLALASEVFAFAGVAGGVHADLLNYVQHGNYFLSACLFAGAIVYLTAAPSTKSIHSVIIGELPSSSLIPRFEGIGTSISPTAAPGSGLRRSPSRRESGAWRKAKTSDGQDSACSRRCCSPRS